MYDELQLDTLGDKKTALFLIMSDTDSTFNFLISMVYTQLFNLLCDKADDVYGGKLPVHVRCLIDECANIGQIPKLEKLMATIRSREISACLVLQAQSQLKALYKDNCDTIIGNCDSSIFLGGKEPTTLKELSAALAEFRGQVVIAPGNHDCYTAASPYARTLWPENVHIFTTPYMTRMAFPQYGCTVYGAAFTAPVQDESLLAGFRAPEDDFIHLMVLHGDISATESRYDPLTKGQIKESGIDYLALGHTHQFGGFLREGQTTYAYSGCPEGRGFDELGEKGILTGTVERGKAELSFVPFARRRYEVLNVDVTGRSAEDALRASLPDATVRDIYRIIFTGETDERGLDLKSIEEQFAPDFFHLELRDETRIGEDVWARAQEDSLRGLFLRELRTKFDVASSDDERAKISLAARFGLAALDGCDL